MRIKHIQKKERNKKGKKKRKRKRKRKKAKQSILLDHRRINLCSLNVGREALNRKSETLQYPLGGVWCVMTINVLIFPYSKAGPVV